MSRKNKTGRNDPCPCGSGIKHKKCCLRRIEESSKQSYDYNSGSVESPLSLDELQRIIAKLNLNK